MIFRKETITNELYVYLNDKLIYKRWLDTRQSKVFDVMAYDQYTLKSIKESDSLNLSKEEGTNN